MLISYSEQKNAAEKKHPSKNTESEQKKKKNHFRQRYQERESLHLHTQTEHKGNVCLRGGCASIRQAGTGRGRERHDGRVHAAPLTDTFRELSDGEHTFRLRGIDGRG